jgi:hypothetical protein
MSSLVERGNLERAARAGRGLLEDERDVLAGEVLLLTAGRLIRLQRLRQRQQLKPLEGSEVDLLEEVTTAQIV